MSEGGKEGGKEKGGSEGGKEGRKEGGKEREVSQCLPLPFLTYYHILVSVLSVQLVHTAPVLLQTCTHRHTEVERSRLC